MPVSTNVEQRLTQPTRGEEIVISGLAGCYPQSDNVYQYRDNLFNKVDMVTDCWNLDHPEIPKRSGKLFHLNKFDASFFNFDYKEAHTMDPQGRMLLERTYEAIVDAGFNPSHLKGQKVGVFIGSCYSETTNVLLYEDLLENGYVVSGCSRAMLANRISYWLGVTGPSYTLDSACSTGSYALEHAYKAMHSGHCDSAIVGASNLCMHPYLSLLFSQLGVLNLEGICKAFDRDANGYARSEAICVLFLQKARNAKRIYATVVHAKTNSDGFKDQGITYPSGKMQKALLEEFYQECGIDPNSLEYVEAHGTGTKVGDPEELIAMDHVFCKERKTPLLIGSVRSNMGHPEPVSGLCSITKMIIAMETGLIPPNLHYTNPREGVEAFVAGRMKVVTEISPLNSSLVGINSFGFGGSNAHILLQQHQKNKVNGGAPTDSVPRLVVASGRTEEAVDAILTDVESRPVDAEFVGLMHDLQSTEIINHKYRGYTLITQDGRKLRSIKYYPGSKRPVWFVFTGMGSQWPGMGKSLLRIPVFAAAIDKCQQALKPHGIDVLNIITSDDPRIFGNILNCFVGIAACQIGLVDIMKAVGIEPDGIVGHSVGELGCGYMDGCFTAEQMVLAAYYRGRASLETELIDGLMAAVGLGAEQAKKLCPPDIEVACHNGPNFCTLSGPTMSMKKFVKALQQYGVFAREVNCGNIAYHSRYIASVGSILFKYLKQLIPDPKPRSARWVSSSVPQSEWNTSLAAHSSAEYHTNNLLNAVLFEEASRHIPANAITIEIAPHGLLQVILKCSLSRGTTNIALTQRGHPNCTELLLTSLGKLYKLGLQPQLANLYPPIQYPVSRGTPMISPLVRWEHSEDWHVTYDTEVRSKSCERCVDVNLKDGLMQYLSGHVIDGRNLFPAIGYLELVWESVGLMVGQIIYHNVPIVFEDVRFHRSTNLAKEGTVKLIVSIQKASGKFEIVESKATVVSGLVRVPSDVSHEMVALDPTKLPTDDDLLELSSRDIYKELRLRRYNYQGLFRSLVCTDNHSRTGKIHWESNWVVFMDNMLQMQILQNDTRGLFVPTYIQKLTIDPNRHITEAHALAAENEDVSIPVHVYKELCIIQSGGVELRGLRASPIAQRKSLSKPVLEKYVFTPNVQPAYLDLHTALQVCTHITLENQLGIKVKVVELHNPGTTPLSPAVAIILGDLPLIKADITILGNASNLSGEELSTTGIKIEDHKLGVEHNCSLVIASNILMRTELLKTAVGALTEGACILAREKLDTESVFTNDFKLQIVFEKSLSDEKLLLLRKGVLVNDPVVIHVASQNYNWLQEVKTAISSNLKRHIILVAQGEPLSGILGLVNCIRKEPGGKFVRCFFILDTSALPFDLNLPLYQQQLNKDLVMNVYNDGKWGSYRHLPLDSCATVTVPHAYVKIMTRGDLSSFKWLEGNLNPNSIQAKPDEELVHVYYSALNFKDVMTATGKLSLKTGRSCQNLDCDEGLEFSGRDQKGRRVMGMVPARALASVLLADRVMMWKVPEHWTLEDAATVPVVYGTAYYALEMIGHMRKGETVLIHAGSGGVGQAAINICLHAGCTVYTTVGTKEKRDFIKKQFPQLTDRHIGNSRDTSFELLVMSETHGRGVDLILNSLAEEKLQASIRCLAPRGRFLEIGKFDLMNNNTFGMEVFLKEASFHGVLLDDLLVSNSVIEVIKKKKLYDIVAEGILSGTVRPLTRTVFPDTEVEQAFRYMAAGKHIGKVMLQIRPEEDRKVVIPAPWMMQACPQYFCNPNCTYIITGGLGGFGLELANWLVSRGASKLVLSSRTGVKTGYQSLHLRVWHSNDVKAVICLADITTKSGVTSLLSEANKLGPVDAIFNLAVVLRDGLLENQTEADFAASAGPKAIATHHLDILSRQMCPHLRHFLVFSSVSCGHGNAGQTNYGMSNSVMERICEARVRDGFPGLAVQWGAVGDVGLVAEMQEEHTDVVIGGTLVQRISSCLEVLDGFMRQSCPIVASMVVAEKGAASGGYSNPIDCVSNIMGIRDRKTISPNSTLAELGMDSMMVVEIKQSFEREFEIFLTTQEIRILTFARLEELAAGKQKTEEEKEPSQASSGVNENVLEGMQLLVRMVGEEASAAELIVGLPSANGIGIDVEDETKAGPVLFMLPGLEGMASMLEPLAKNLKYQTVCLQLGYNDMGYTVHDMTQYLLPHLRSKLVPGVPFNLLGYSFGGLLAMELALKLEEEGWEGNLYLVDTSPDFIKALYEHITQNNVDRFETNLLCAIFNILAPLEISSGHLTKLFKELALLKNWKEKLDYLISILPKDKLKGSSQHYKSVGNSTNVRMKAASSYKWVHKKTIKSHTILLKSTSIVLNIEEDYGLSKCCEKKVEVHFVTGNHVTMLDNEDAAAIINRQVPNIQLQ